MAVISCRSFKSFLSARGGQRWTNWLKTPSKRNCAGGDRDGPSFRSAINEGQHSTKDAPGISWT